MVVQFPPFERLYVPIPSPSLKNGIHGTIFAEADKLIIDGTVVVEVNNSRFLAGGRVEIEHYESQINVSSFKITAL